MNEQEIPGNSCLGKSIGTHALVYEYKTCIEKNKIPTFLFKIQICVQGVKRR